MRRRAILLLILNVIGITPSTHATTPSLDQVIISAFQEVHDGWSSDEVLLQDTLNQRFIVTCRANLRTSGIDKAETNQVSEEQLNWKLLNLRKAGKLRAATEKRRRDDHADYQHLAEIVARSMQDQYKVSTDHIMCNPEQRVAFDKAARAIAPKVESYLMRKSAFGLRKARKLRPELVLRVADWDRTVTSYQASQVAKDATLIPKTPGIYIFRDETGYLYIGESLDLRVRLSKHLDNSDRQSLARYLRANGIQNATIEVHAFPKTSRARKASIRRAYESELIASRKPRFNVRP